MKYRKLGRTGAEVSVVGVGTWQFGGEWGIKFTQAEVDAIFNAGRECGINLIDTAECYGDHLSEKFIGKAIARDREKWFIATKFGHQFHRPFERDVVTDPQQIVKQLETSLRALGTDCVDLYQFHSLGDEAFQTAGLWETLRAEKESGRIRFLGISISPNDNVFQTDRATEVGADVIQVVYNRLSRVPEDGVFHSCERQHLGVLARVPLASGFLSGKYKPGDTFDAADVREQWMKDGRDDILEEVQKIAKTEVPDGMNMAQWALAWCLKNPIVTASIPGCKSADQVRSNAAAADIALD